MRAGRVVMVGLAMAVAGLVGLGVVVGLPVKAGLPGSPGPVVTSVVNATPSLMAHALPVTRAAVSVPGLRCHASGLAACVDLSAQQAWLVSGGKVIYGPVPITSGRPGYRTPAGVFHVLWKDIDHRSTQFDNAPMPYSVFFYSGDAFHAGSLRVPSHGCIHLSWAAAKKFFATLQVGDVVQIMT